MNIEPALRGARTAASLPETSRGEKGRGIQESGPAFSGKNVMPQSPSLWL